MESEEIKKGYDHFLNQNVKIIYYDSPEHATIKVGTLISNSVDAIILFEIASQKEVLIPKSRLVRVELQNMEAK